MTNIPIFRAKKIDSDEWVEGYLIGHYIFKEWIDDFWTSYGETMSNKAEVYNIDVSTLAIHFPDMIDSQGNKIFASLNEDGKGGDIIHHKKPYCKDDRKYYEWNVKFDKRRITPFAEREYWNPSRVPLKDILTNPKAYIKVVGVQE